VITAIINLIAYHFFATKLKLIDIRDMSLFGSHIRYGILIGIGLTFCFERIYTQRKHRNVYVLASVFFLVYTFYSQVLSGIISVAIVLIALLTFLLYIKRLYSVLVFSYVLFIGGLIGLFYYLSIPVNYPVPCTERYDEMESAWNKRSSLNYDSLDQRKQPVSSTLERYLSSKALCARESGVNQLSEEDIHFIERGYADVHETYGGIQARLLDIRYQLHHASNPSGHSILERIEYWKNAWAVIENHWMFGVGTGDVDDAMQNMYNERQSSLTPERRLRAHNSYLTYYLTFGILGFLFFLYFQFKFIIQQFKWQQSVGFLFGLIALVTFLFEDTLESQMGITLFAFFYAVFSRKITSK
jgi:O-antigen ligase